MRRMLVVISASAAIGIAACAGTASASNGYGAGNGALNMLNDPTMFTVAMVNDTGNAGTNPNGNDGMFGAVCHSIGEFCP
jgi:hypothetical protein